MDLKTSPHSSPPHLHPLYNMFEKPIEKPIVEPKKKMSPFTLPGPKARYRPYQKSCDGIIEIWDLRPVSAILLTKLISQRTIEQHIKTI